MYQNFFLFFEFKLELLESKNFWNFFFLFRSELVPVLDRVSLI